MRIAPYTENLRVEWDSICTEADKCHFMLNRGYIDYHGERFVDASAVVINDTGDIVGIFPANINGEAIYSHQGLSFGGLVMKKDHSSCAKIVDALVAIKDFYRSGFYNVKEIIYKRMPDIYASSSCEGDLYALFRVGATLIRRDANTVVQLDQPVVYSRMRARRIRRAKASGISVERDIDYASFWSLLTKVLRTKGVAPVHSLEEIRRIKELFPKNVCLYSAYLDNELVAGALVYKTPYVAHTQYLASSAEGRHISALDIVLDRVIQEYSKTRRCVSFGISTEQDGHMLNEGLVGYKEGFGGKTVVHDFFRIDLRERDPGE